MNSSTMMLNTLLLPSLLLGSGAEPNFMIHMPPEPPTHSTAYLFAHGLGATQQQAQALLPHNKYSIINTPCAVFDFADAKKPSANTKPSQVEYDAKYVNLGQDIDMDRLRYAYYKMLQELPNFHCVGVGVSRGAVTLLNCTDLDWKALVLESPFDTFNSVIKHLLRRFHIGWIPFSKKLAIRYVKKTFPQFDMNGVFPLTICHMVPQKPILLVHAKSDKTIPIKSSRLIYYALRENNPHVYLLELNEGNHGKLITGPEGELYQNVVHAFYKKYGLPHNSVFAQRGEEFLQQCQPSLDSMKKYGKKLRKIRRRMTREIIEAAKAA